jgi:hypothetical protein
VAGTDKIFNSRQLAFKELFVGTFIYAAVLGFFNDYTGMVEAKSFSTIFLAAIVLEVLTFLTFLLKNHIVRWLKDKPGPYYRALLFFCVWLVMFCSKFVFVWAVDAIFGNNINIDGFFSILLLIVSVTAIHQLADYTFKHLGSTPS